MQNPYRIFTRHGLTWAARPARHGAYTEIWLFDGPYCPGQARLYRRVPGQGQRPIQAMLRRMYQIHNERTAK